MTRHFSEAELLETYYMQPGESMPVMMHLAGCSDCASKYERLERKLREAAVCDSERPDTFWARQRYSIMRRIEAPERRLRAPLRVAAAAVLAFSVGGFVMYRHAEPPRVQHAPAAAEHVVPADPWESEQLQDYHAVVEWESWVPEQNENEGTL